MMATVVNITSSKFVDLILESMLANEYKKKYICFVTFRSRPHYLYSENANGLTNCLQGYFFVKSMQKSSPSFTVDLVTLKLVV